MGFSRRCAPRSRPMLPAEGASSAADLPGDLDDDGRLVLVRRLIREGFLRRAVAGWLRVPAPHVRCVSSPSARS